MMVNQIDSKLDITPEPPEHHYSPRRRPEIYAGMFDEIITSLANSLENRRARQVVEWERMRRKTLRLAM